MNILRNSILILTLLFSNFIFANEKDYNHNIEERITEGAFDRAIEEQQDVRALWNHDPNFVLGRTKSGTLKLSSDSHGLKVDINPPDTQWAKDLVESVRRGDVDQMSFGFIVRKDKWYEDRDTGIAKRELIDVDLFDVSREQTKIHHY